MGLKREMRDDEIRERFAFDIKSAESKFRVFTKLDGWGHVGERSNRFCARFIRKTPRIRIQLTVNVPSEFAASRSESRGSFTVLSRLSRRRRNLIQSCIRFIEHPS